jgi:hypothetical protein
MADGGIRSRTGTRMTHPIRAVCGAKKSGYEYAKAFVR